MGVFVRSTLSEVYNRYYNTNRALCDSLSCRHPSLKHMIQCLLMLVVLTNLTILTKIKNEDISCIFLFYFSYFVSTQYC